MFTRHDESLRIINADLAARVDARRVELYDRYCAWRKDKTRPMPDKTHGKYLLSGGMLKCPTCGRHFEARHNRKKGVALYMCSTRRRMPGMCSNDFSLPIEDADDDVLNIVEGQLLEPQIIEEVLKLVDDSVDKTTYVQSNRDRLQEEVNNLVDSIAKKFIAPEDAGAQIQRRKEEIARLDAELRKPRPPRVQRERLRAALEQRIASWKAELRAEPRIARIVLRRLIGPLTLHGEHRGPDETYFEYWEASIKPEGLLDGLVQVDQSQTTT